MTTRRRFSLSLSTHFTKCLCEPWAGMVETRLLDFGQGRQDLLQPQASSGTESAPDATNGSRALGDKNVEVGTALQKVRLVIVGPC